MRRGAGCLSAVVCVASGSFAVYECYHELYGAGFWVATVICVLSLLVTLVTWTELGVFLLDILEAVFTSVH